MDKKSFLYICIFALIVLVLAACSAIATPTTVSTATTPPSTATLVPTVWPINPIKPSAPTSTIEAQSKSGVSVDVDVTPKVLEVGQPMAFEIFMNTHSVDFGDGQTQLE